MFRGRGPEKQEGRRTVLRNGLVVLLEAMVSDGLGAGRAALGELAFRVLAHLRLCGDWLGRRAFGELALGVLAGCGERGRAQHETGCSESPSCPPSDRASSSKS